MNCDAAASYVSLAIWYTKLLIIAFLLIAHVIISVSNRNNSVEVMYFLKYEFRTVAASEFGGAVALIVCAVITIWEFLNKIERNLNVCIKCKHTSEMVTYPRFITRYGNGNHTAVTYPMYDNIEKYISYVQPSIPRPTKTKSSMQQTFKQCGHFSRF